MKETRKIRTRIGEYGEKRRRRGIEIKYIGPLKGSTINCQ